MYSSHALESAHPQRILLPRRRSCTRRSRASRRLCSRWPTKWRRERRLSSARRCRPPRRTTPRRWKRAYAHAPLMQPPQRCSPCPARGAPRIAGAAGSRRPRGAASRRATGAQRRTRGPHAQCVRAGDPCAAAHRCAHVDRTREVGLLIAAAGRVVRDAWAGLGSLRVVQ